MRFQYKISQLLVLPARAEYAGWELPRLDRTRRHQHDGLLVAQFLGALIAWRWDRTSHLFVFLALVRAVTSIQSLFENCQAGSFFNLMIAKLFNAVYNYYNP